ncbi:hypothetical protein ACRALDRAFT_1066444, partial [Sodiomyces alcalophilus JCM 7366]|uniref:uncharacterized protein n=1 Tax=Sodiomyces alcalophilus JCM 7366 TaxID=591952 RepID=UPI0039B36727
IVRYTKPPISQTLRYKPGKAKEFLDPLFLLPLKSFLGPIVLAGQRYIRKVRVPTLLNNRGDYSSYTILGDIKGVRPLAIIANAYLDIAKKVFIPEYRLLLFIADVVKGKELAPFTAGYDSPLIELNIKESL